MTFSFRSVNVLNRMSKIPPRFRDSFALTHILIREQMAPLAVLFIFGAALTITIEDTMLALPRTDDTQRWVLQIGLGLWELVEGVLTMLILSWGVPKVRALTEAHFAKTPFQESYLNSFLAEYLRVLANTLLWGLLLLVPGFWRYCRLAFVPYIALFARPYRDGKVDALDLSAHLTRGRMPLIIGVILATTALQGVFTFLPQLVPGLHDWPYRAGFAGVILYVSIWLFSALYLQFENAMENFRWT